MEVLELLVRVYLSIAAIKLALAAVDLPLAAAVMHRITGRPLRYCMLLLSVCVPLTIVVTWPKTLADEGWRFFLAYTRFSVMKSMAKVYRSLAANPREEQG